MSRIRNAFALFTEYADQSENPAGSSNDFVIPEDLTTLSDADLTALNTEATNHFDTLYGDGLGLEEDDLNALGVLTEGIEALAAEIDVREAAAAERAERAEALAAKIGRTKPEASSEEEADGEDEDEESNVVLGENEAGDEAEAEAATSEETTEERELVTASAKRGERRINMNRVNSRALPTQRKESSEAPTKMQDIVFAAGEGNSVAAGTGLDWLGLGKSVDRRLAGFNQTQYANAARKGQHMRQQFSVATIHKPLDSDLVINSNDPMHVNEVMERAVNQKRLKGGSLVASGGWCAPSETIYDLLELESRDGLFSVPEVGIARGGISRTLGPNFADIYSSIQGFSYTEENDIAGQYGVDANGVGNATEGDKPCYQIECPDFEEFRLGLDGLCLTAGLLQQRGYPEVIARTVRGALVAHDHRLSGKLISAIVAGSDAVTMATPQAGAAAPLLDAIEMQVEHLRYTTRIARSTVIEGVFPYWVRGVVRSDLARRSGVELLAVNDAQINAWFTLRGIAPQYVYNWQDITGDASAFTAWPTTVDFLLYPAGTWIRGASDIITLDTLYDSTQLGQNNYTALFTEEGWMAVKMGHESRVVTVPLCADGSASSGVVFDCNGGATEA